MSGDTCYATLYVLIFRSDRPTSSKARNNLDVPLLPEEKQSVKPNSPEGFEMDVRSASTGKEVSAYSNSPLIIHG